MIIYVCMCVSVCENETERKSAESRGKHREGEALDGEVPGRVPCLLGFLDLLTDYVNYRECSVGRTLQDLTRIACNRNIQNIPILLHSHESFSTCVATNKTLRVSHITTSVVKHRKLQ